jgi:hypothetical protein
MSSPTNVPRTAALLLRHPLLLSVWCVVASFGAYACMYAFRKPFTAGTYTTEPFDTVAGFKTWLVLAQVLGYTISKFAGIKIIAEMQPSRRATALLGLIGLAQASWLLFGIVPPPYNVAFLFLNGLPLGMVFGLVLGFLEGRKMTEAFIAGLCASFILAGGFTKTVGAYLLEIGVSERWMPFWAGMIFILPLAGFVWMLKHIPPPSVEDVAARSARAPMSRAERWAMFRRYAVGLVAITFAYLLVTVLRGMRDDFAPELWAALGAKVDSAVFTWSEVCVTLGILVINGLLVLVKDNRKAFFLALNTALMGLAGIGVVLWAHSAGLVGSFPFMVLMGLGLYIPYVAVHTTIFERLIAMTRDRGNIGYLMYLADAFGYLGYVAVMVGKNFYAVKGDILKLFIATGWIVAIGSILSLTIAILFFARRSRSLVATASPQELALQTERK